MSIVADTAERFDYDVQVLFQKAAEARGFTNALEVANFRYMRYLQYNEIPPYVEDYALQMSETHG